MNEDKLLTVKEVAGRLRVSERTIMRYIKSKKLIASKLGQWRIAESALDSIFRENLNKPRKNKN